MLNKKLFADTMAVIGGMVGKILSSEVSKVYYRVMQDMSDDVFIQAAEHVISTHKFNTFPAPAVFIQAVQADKDALIIAAWHKVEGAMREHGAYPTVIFDDALIHGFIQGLEGGWPGLCAKTLDEMVWLRKDFERYYRAMNAESVTCRPLVGITEGSNVVGGYDRKHEPVYIGDAVKAAALVIHETPHKMIEGIAKDMEATNE